MQTPAPLLADDPRTLGDHVVAGRLGGGRRGDVYVVLGPGLPDGRAVLSLPPAGVLHTPERRARFEREADRLAGLSHPGLVPVLGRGEHAGRPWLATAFAPGWPLDALLAERGALPPALAVALLRQLADALARLHGAGLLHRDLRPSCVVVDETVEPPAARLVGVETGPGPDASQRWRGGPPEALGLQPAAPDARGDLYALGLVAAAMLLGRLPFDGLPPLERQHAHATRLPALPAGTPPALAAIVLALLHKDPAARYAGAAAVAADLGRLQQRLGAGDGTPFPLALHAGRDGIAPPRLVGRDAERQRLDDAYLRARDGLQLLGVAGGPGLGKSRLLAEASRAWGHGPVLGGRGRPLGQTAPYGLVCDALQALAAQPARDGVQAALCEALGREGAELVALVPALRPLLGDTGAAVPVAPEHRQRRRLHLLASLFGALGRADAPLVLVFDDLQWADDGSLRFLVHLVRHAAHARVLVLLAWRDDALRPGGRLARWLDGLRALAPLPVLALAPLADDELRALAASMLGPMPPGLADALVVHARGHPMQAVERVRTLVARGALQPGDGGWAIDGDALAGLARGVDDLAQTVAQRLDTLDADTREVLAIAAVAGRTVGAGPLRDVLARQAGLPAPVAAQRVDAALAAAEAAWLLAPMPGHHAWLHEPARAALYAALGELRRRTLHRAFAALTVAPDDVAAAGLRAHHARLAGDPRPAFDAAVAAGDLARRHGAPLEALAFYAQAQLHATELTPAERSAGVAALAPAVAEAQVASGQLEPARRCCEALLARPGDPVALGAIARSFAALLHRHGETGRALTVLADAVERLGERVPRGGWAIGRLLLVEGARRFWYAQRSPRPRPGDRAHLLGELYAMRAALLVHVDLVAACAVQLRACNLLARDGDALTRARAAGTHGVLCGLLSAPALGWRAATQAAALQRDLGARWQHSQTLCQRMLPLLQQARWDECIDDGRFVLAELERQGAPVELAIATCLQHHALAASGRWDEAVQLFAQQRRLAGRPGGAASGAWSVVLRADLLPRHDAVQLLADARAAWEPCVRGGDVLAMAALRRAEGRAAAALGLWRDAQTAFDEARAHVLRGRMRLPLIADVLLDRVELLQRRAAETGDAAARAAWRATAGRALAEARLLLAGVPALAAWLLRLRAGQCRLRGRAAAAERLWRRAVASAGEHRLPLQRGLALVDWAQALQERAPQRAAHLRAEAGDVFALLGIDHPALRPAGRPGTASAEAGPLAHRLQALVGIVQRLAEQASPEALLAAAVESAVQLLGAERGLLYLRDAPGGPASCRARAGGDEALAAPLSSSVVEHVLAGGRGLVLADAPADPGGVPSDGALRAAGCTVLCTPLLHGGDVLGVLYLDRRLPRGAFGEPDLSLLQALAAQAAVGWRTLSRLAELDGGLALLEARVAERTEALVQARAEAEAAERAKNAFLANMSHEIRTPMNAIFGMTHLMMQTPLTPRQADCLQKVDRSAQLLLGLLSDVIDLARTEAGRLELASVPFTLPEVLDPLVAMLGPPAAARGLRLVLDVAAELPPRLIGDPLRLTQVLANLGRNALKFTEHGEVIVQVRGTRVGAGHHRLHFVVQDSGCGIAEAERERLFQPFSPGDAAPGRRSGGAGVGLAISRQFVRLMGGDIECQSEPGVGSRFAFDVAVLAEAGPVAAWPLPGLRALLVADHPASQHALAGMLRGLGATASVCAALPQAMEWLVAPPAGQPFGVVVLDVDAVPAALAPLAALPGRPPVVAVSGQAADVAGGAPWIVLARPAVPWTLQRGLQSAGLGERTPPREPAPAPAAGRLAGMRVLLAEDNEINRDFTVEVLREAGVQVGTAEDGAQALARLAEQPFDLVLMDCQMPVLDGYEATRRLRADARWRTLPVIAMTAFAMRGDRELALAAGMTDVITKPVRVPQLLEALARWSGRGGDAAPAQSSAQPASGPASTGPTTSGAGIT